MALFMIAVLTGAFVALNALYINNVNVSIQELSETSIEADDRYHRIANDLKDEKTRMSFMAHVMDIKNILDSNRKTRSYNTMDFAYLIAKESFDNNLDPLLVLAVIKTESSFRKTVVSHKGAIGLMQILPNTAQYVSQMHDHIELTHSEELFEPDTNILIGINYLSYLVDKFENQKYAIIAYNMGPTG